MSRPIDDDGTDSCSTGTVENAAAVGGHRQQRSRATTAATVTRRIEPPHFFFDNGHRRLPLATPGLTADYDHQWRIWADSPRSATGAAGQTRASRQRMPPNIWSACCANISYMG